MNIALAERSWRPRCSSVLQTEHKNSLFQWIVLILPLFPGFCRGATSSQSRGPLNNRVEVKSGGLEIASEWRQELLASAPSVQVIRICHELFFAIFNSVLCSLNYLFMSCLSFSVFVVVYFRVYFVLFFSLFYFCLPFAFFCFVFPCLFAYFLFFCLGYILFIFLLFFPLTFFSYVPLSFILLRLFFFPFVRFFFLAVAAKAVVDAPCWDTEDNKSYHPRRNKKLNSCIWSLL